jgi:hypothetical protein
MLPVVYMDSNRSWVAMNSKSVWEKAHLMPRPSQAKQAFFQWKKMQRTPRAAQAPQRKGAWHKKD